MDNQEYNSIVSFIWGIADDCLRDVYVRGKYRDVILPMTVIRRLDVMLEGTKPAVLEMKKQLDAAENQMHDVLKAAMETHGVKSFTSTDGTVAFTYVPATTRTTVDSKRLKAEKPDLFAEYSKESNVAASVRIKVEK